MSRWIERIQAKMRIKNSSPLRWSRITTSDAGGLGGADRSGGQGIRHWYRILQMSRSSGPERTGYPKQTHVHHLLLLCHDGSVSL